MNDYNWAIELGTVRYGPTLVDMSEVNKKPYTRLTLYVRRNGKQQIASFDVRGYGKIGDDMYQNIRNGDRILVEGPVYSSAYTGKDGKPKATMFLFCQKWMPDQTEEETALHESEAIGKTERTDEQEGYGDNAEMLF